LVLVDAGTQRLLDPVMSAEQYDALPEKTRAEIVDGVLHLMAPPTLRHQMVARALANALERLASAATDRPETDPDASEPLVIVHETEVRFGDGPVHARIPDILVLRAAGLDPLARRVRPSQVVLVIEVVSPGSETADRSHKPIEYAGAGIEHFWRVELRPLQVVTHRLESGSYAETGSFGPEDTVEASGLGWARVDVSKLDR
jgi:Uma2 family endonuclease